MLIKWKVKSVGKENEENEDEDEKEEEEEETMGKQTTETLLTYNGAACLSYLIS